MSIRDEFSRIKPLAWGLLTAAGLIFCAFTLIGFAGGLWWVFELFSHFRLQYLISLAIVSVLLLCGRKFRTSSVLGFFALTNLVLILPYYFVADKPRMLDAVVLRAISINVNTANKRYDLVKQYVLENSPDVLLLVEVDEGWLKAMAEIENIYPYKKLQPQSGNFGIALYSKLPYKTCEIAYFSDAGIPSIVAEFEFGGKHLTLLATHSLPPIDRKYAELRNAQLEAIASYMAQVTGPKMLIGDLNATPWSHQFGKLLGEASLKDSARGLGLQLTWPTHSLMLRLPIDHCLVSSDIHVLGRRVGANVGSDHFPILVDFALTE